VASRLRRFRYAAGCLLLVACLAGCVSMPSGGALQSYPVTQGGGAQSQRYLQIIPEPPGAGWSPSEIVQGFLTASASFADRQRTAREYLTTARNGCGWNPGWSATVFASTGPNVRSVILSGGGKRKQPTAATVTVTGTVQASLSGSDTYAVPSGASSTAGGQSYTFDLVKAGGQWRISCAPPELLLTSIEFKVDYQLRNLYFFDPTGHYLVPDPVYVPLQTTPSDLMKGLVEDLITQPKDWLAYGATTAFPPGTKLMSDVVLDGDTAVVNLGGAITRAKDPVLLERVSAQLYSTLTGSSQGQQLVQSVELLQDGKPWSPLDQPDNPVQHDSGGYSVPPGTSSQFYYLDNDGVLWRRSGADGAVGAPVKVASIGSGYTTIAVSRDGRYLAALRNNGMVYAGPVDGPLTPRTGTGGYLTLSWGRNDNLWAAGSDGVVMLRANESPRSAAGAPVQVQVVGYGGDTVAAPFTALSVAPDGVRVAVIITPSDLSFGAIVEQPAHRGQQAVVKIQLSQFSVSAQNATSFQSVTWYGPDNVITRAVPTSALAGSTSGPALTEYPVNGGTATKISSQQDIVWITASYGSALIAETDRAALLSDASISGSWTPVIGTGPSLVPAYPG
jgi:hypothetical protein